MQLLADLALHHLDVVLAGQAAPRNPNLRLASERLVDSSVEWYGPAALVGRAERGRFPQSPDLIRKGKAYVCDLSPEEMTQHRGTLAQPGRDSPHRNRAIEESLDLFRRMCRGEFPDGSRTLRAKIDMASPNLNLRDPVMYRIRRAHHHRTGDAWCIYPTYDYAHGQSDSLEGITHSLCSLEFEDHRPLYEWYIRELGIFSSRQIEFARLNLTYTVMSKRRLLDMVEQGAVHEWDDPRMPTLSGQCSRPTSSKVT